MRALQAWSSLRDRPVSPLTGGLINATWRLGDPPVAVLQRLHPIFAPEVNLDIEAITAHVAARGLVTPRVVATDEGALWTVDDDGSCWRVLSWVPGVTHHKLSSPTSRLRSAARLRTIGRSNARPL